MIRYKNKISLIRTRAEEWVIESDRGSKYLTSQITNTTTPITDWWDKQHPSELRLWQKDALIKSLCDAFGEMDLFTVYKSGAGYSQPHDIVMARHTDIWIFATELDTWIVKDSSSQVWLNKEDSLGSILDRTTREEIYKIADAIKTTNVRYANN